MDTKRSFSADGIPTKSADYHGTSTYRRTMPDIAAKSIQSVNVVFDFEEAVRLSLAIQSCVLSLNRYKRSSSAGKAMGMLLSLKTDGKTVTVIESSVSSSRKTTKTTE
jgi:hypothetical protein